MRAKFRFLDESFEVAPVQRGAPMVISVGARDCVIDRHTSAASRQQLLIDNTLYDAVVGCDGNDIFVHVDGEAWHVQALNPIEAASAGGSGSLAVLAPMPGVVVSVLVSDGDSVSAGQTLLVIESMKLQTTIIADRDGVIAAVCFGVDQTFDKGVELMRYEAAEE
jgi:biotin carboxyl carrier protein